MKSVVLIPVIHSAADLGSLAESVREHYLTRYGPAAWGRREQAVAAIWAEIARRIDRLGLDYGKTRIYQDGLPVCGQELGIVEKLAAAGSTNHQIVLDLVHRGAALVGTEDPRLLIREYQMHREQLGAGQPGGVAGMPGAMPTSSWACDEHGHEDVAMPPGPSAEAVALLEARDRFIAQRIAETLQDGQTGLLFLGAAHRIDGLMSPDILVYPLD